MIYSFTSRKCKKWNWKPAQPAHVIFSPDTVYKTIPSRLRDNDVIIVRSCGQIIPVKAKSLKALMKAISGSVKAIPGEKSIEIYHSHDGKRYTGKATLLHFFPNTPRIIENQVTL